MPFSVLLALKAIQERPQRQDLHIAGFERIQGSCPEGVAQYWRLRLHNESKTDLKNTLVPQTQNVRHQELNIMQKW